MTSAWWTDPRTAPENIQTGADCRIAPNASLDGANGRISLGDRCVIHPGTMLLPYGGTISLGNDCSVNPYCVLYGHGGLTIGNDVRIAAHTVIIPGNHVFSDPDLPIRSQGMSQLGIEIGDDVWIGCHVTILDGSRIGRGSVIAAGSVVRGNVAPFSIMGGVPARLLKKRDARESKREPNVQ